MIGGPPCQGFSALGKQEQLDERNQLWLRYAETIRKSKPKYFVLENVPQFLTSVQLARFKRQCQPSQRLGTYTFQAMVLNAADYGAAQSRKRVILIGHTANPPFPGFPDPTHGKKEWRKLKDVLEGLPERVTARHLPDGWIRFAGKDLPGVFETVDLHLTRYYEQRSLERIAYVRPGGNRFQIPTELLSTCWKKHESGSADVMGRLVWDNPRSPSAPNSSSQRRAATCTRENRALTHPRRHHPRVPRRFYVWVDQDIDSPTDRQCGANPFG